MGWLEIRWDESGSVFDELDHILEGLTVSTRGRRKLESSVEPDEADEEVPGYAWLSHPTIAHAKVWSPVPLLPTGPSSPPVGHSSRSNESLEDATP